MSDTTDDNDDQTIEERYSALKEAVMEAACDLYSGHGHTPEQLREMTPLAALHAAIRDVNKYWGYA